MEEEKLISLIRHYINGTASEEELDGLRLYINRDENAESISGALEKVLADSGANADYDAARFDPLLKNILSADRVNKTPVRKLGPLRWAAAAAVIIFMLGAGSYFLFFNKPQKQIVQTETQQQRFKNDVSPGGNKAVLTLANGTQIILDSAAKGTISQQGNIKIIKLDSGLLAYNGLGTNEEVLYNTISTPKGGQYQIVLADGSKVWLNAASSLRFPTSFNKDRNVELTGEGYFEVVHNRAKPFRVSVNGMMVEDLGTHFNINAYQDEATIKTTLLEGSVKILPFGKAQGKLAQDDRGSTGKVIKPGEQAILPSDKAPGKQDDNLIKVQKVDLDEAVAWKEGRFYFDGTDIKTIMRQLSRWYDVDVIYQADINYSFVARIARDVPVSELLKLLELTGGVHFKIEGKKITIMK